MQPELLDNFLAWTKGGITGSVQLNMMLLQGTEDTETINKNGVRDYMKTLRDYKPRVVGDTNYANRLGRAEQKLLPVDPLHQVVQSSLCHFVSRGNCCRANVRKNEAMWNRK